MAVNNDKLKKERQISSQNDAMSNLNTLDSSQGIFFYTIFTLAVYIIYID